VVEPVREGFEATRRVSYRDLYFWREMFRLYLEKPIFYAGTERKRGALTFAEARDNLQEYDTKLRNTGLLAKMKTPAAKAAAQQFLNVNLHILKTMHFQEMNSRAMQDPQEIRQTDPPRGPPISARSAHQVSRSPIDQQSRTWRFR